MAIRGLSQTIIYIRGWKRNLNKSWSTKGFWFNFYFTEKSLLVAWNCCWEHLLLSSREPMTLLVRSWIAYKMFKIPPQVDRLDGLDCCLQSIHINTALLGPSSYTDTYIYFHMRLKYRSTMNISYGNTAKGWEGAWKGTTTSNLTSRLFRHRWGGASGFSSGTVARDCS